MFVWWLWRAGCISQDTYLLYQHNHNINDNPHHNTKHPGPATTEPPPGSDNTIALLTGGYNDDGRLSLSEVFPSTNGCSPLSLPEVKYGHTLFTTAEPRPRAAVCGGFDGSFTASCLVLDKQTGTWDESRLGSLTIPRFQHTAVTLKNIGNYLIGGSGHRKPGLGLRTTSSCGDVHTLLCCDK